jgi:large subunit ribosomal protein L15
MSAGVKKFVTVNLQQLNQEFEEGEEVSLESLQAKKLLNLSGRESTLPLKVGSMLVHFWRRFKGPVLTVSEPGVQMGRVPQ